MVSCLTDISKEFSLLLSMREREDIKKKRENNINTVKTLLDPEVNTACCSELLLLFEGPCTSLITFAISFPYTSTPDLKIISPPPSKEDDFVKKLLPESQFFSHPSVALAGSLIHPSLLQKESAMLSTTLCGQAFEESEWDENFKHQARI